MNDRIRSAASAPRHVLFALSDETVARALARVVESRAHVGRIAVSIEDAILGGPADVVVAELGGASDALDGLALVDAFRDLESDPLVILVAGPDCTSEDLDRAMAARADFVLERPLLPDALVRAIESEQQTEQGEELRILVDASSRAAEDAAREMVAWCVRCEVAPATRARIATALAELVDNAAKHGAHEVEITAVMNSGELSIDVVDDGPGFDAIETLTADPLDCTTGLGRVHALADGVRIERSHRGSTHAQLFFAVRTVEFDDEERIDLTDLDFFVPATARELLATLTEEPDAPVILSPALAVVVGRLLMGPDPKRVLEDALRHQHG
ncbi:MAG: ATP-binding protein [Planctomycetota bacterium]|nr:ATP-binding protein [Planctomycetota bacterium]